MNLANSVLLLTAAVAALAQPLTFEVASVKPAPARVPGVGMRVGITGGPGSKDPGRWSCENLSLSNLVEEAYDLRAFQLVLPDWMQEARFNIAAKLPENATKEQFREMLQTLLVDATGLKGKYDFSIYWVTGRLAGPRPDGEASDPAGPTLFAALQDQLGLKLESKKVTLEVTVVDHAEKTPTEN